MRQHLNTFHMVAERLLVAVFFLLPWQTVWIYAPRFLGATNYSHYNSLMFFAVELLLWTALIFWFVWYALSLRARKNAAVRFSCTPDRLFVSAAGIFAFYALASVFWAPDPDVAWQHATRIMQAALLGIILVSGSLRMERLMLALLLGALAPALLGIAQFFLQTSWSSVIFGLAGHHAELAGTSIVASESIGRWLRAYGTFAHPNILGGFMVIALCAAAFLLFQKNKHAVLASMCSVIFAAALFVSGSRSAWLASGLLMLFWLFWGIIRKRPDVHRFVLYSVSIFVIFSVVFFPFIHVRVFGGSEHEEASLYERTALVQQAAALFQVRPFFGFGAGNYTRAAYTYFTGYPDWWVYQPVHSVPLLIAVELGLAGLFFLLVVLAATVYYIGINRGLGLGAGLIILVPPALLDHYLYSSFAGLMMGVIFLSMWSYMDFFSSRR